MAENDRSKRHGFVCFDTVEEASEAIDKMNRKKLGSMPIFVTLWQSRNERLQSSDNQSTQNSRSVSATVGTSNQPPHRFRLSTRLPN